MKYTIKELRADFPNDDVCLDYIFSHKYPEVKGYHRVSGRKCYAHQSTGHQIHPLAGTIFEKSSTTLTLWFHAIFLFASSKNGVSAKELQRQLGVTYKCAWRIAHQIRSLMEQGTDPLDGTVEVDETYYGKNAGFKTRYSDKTTVVGAVERGESVRAKVVKDRSSYSIAPFVEQNIVKGSNLMTDEAPVYNEFRRTYNKQTVHHARREYARGNVHTNTIEGFWGQFKRSVRGTYHYVSKKHLQSYLDEFAFRYNLRASSVPVFEVLLARV
jgi:transposase